MRRLGALANRQLDVKLIAATPTALSGKWQKDVSARTSTTAWRCRF